MSISSPELIDGYVLEIISRARVIKARCKNLLSKDFASENPKNLAKTLLKICSYLVDATKSIYKSIEWKDNKKIDQCLQLLQTTDSIIRDFSAHIRFVDGGQTQMLPWSFIKPVEKFVKAFLPGVEIMLRPQWKYNYTILTTNLYKYYSDILSGYEYIVPEKSLTPDVLNTLNESFYIVSFPSIERRNILLHCLIGHEIGHLKAKEYFTREREQEVLQYFSDKVAPYIDKLMEDRLRDVPPLFVPEVKQRIAQSEISRAVSTWQKGLEEILSDIIGTFLFGPAVLFSTLEISLQDLQGLDKTPDEDNMYYPP